MYFRVYNYAITVQARCSSTNLNRLGWLSRGVGYKLDVTG